jgi:hypothetical protein
MTAEQLDLGDAPKPRRGAKEPKTAVAVRPEPAGDVLGMLGIRVSDLATLDVDKLDRLFAFQEKLMIRQAQIDFHEAKQRVRKDLINLKVYRRKSVRYDINKNRPALGQEEVFKYARLEDIDEVIAPLLAREGLGVSYTTAPRAGEGGGLLIIMTLNKGVYSEKHEIPLPLDTTGGKSNIQGAASTFSYGRRYLLCMALNIVVYGEDDDGNGGTLDGNQIATLRKLIRAVQTKDESRDEAALCRSFKIKALEDIPQNQMRTAVSRLEEAAAKLGANLDV